MSFLQERLAHDLTDRNTLGAPFRSLGTQPTVGMSAFFMTCHIPHTRSDIECEGNNGKRNQPEDKEKNTIKSIARAERGRPTTRARWTNDLLVAAALTSWKSPEHTISHMDHITCPPSRLHTRTHTRIVCRLAGWGCPFLPAYVLRTSPYSAFLRAQLDLSLAHQSARQNLI